MGQIAQNITENRRRINEAARRAGRDPESIKLIAVSKTVTAKGAMEAIEAGVIDLGESRVQEARRKYEQIGDKAIWHMVGPLQTNKAKYCPGLFSLIHSVDRVELVDELARRADASDVTLEGLLQVNISGEEGKSGCDPDAAADILKASAMKKGFKIKGIMTIAPYDPEPENSRPVYRALYELKNELDKIGIENVSLDILSAGMSNDFEIAIEEGANMVRIGTAIFGQRG